MQQQMQQMAMLVTAATSPNPVRTQPGLMATPVMTTPVGTTTTPITATPVAQVQDDDTNSSGIKNLYNEDEDNLGHNDLNVHMNAQRLLHMNTGIRNENQHAKDTLFCEGLYNRTSFDRGL